MSLESKSLDTPDETHTFDTGRLQITRHEGVTIGRATFEPGWKWSDSLKPVVGTDSCEVAHLGYVVSGRMRVVMDDGNEGDAGPGDLVEVAPGHDAWILGHEPCVFVDFTGAAD